MSRAMEIGIDRQAFTIQKYGGISRYFSDLYQGLLKEPGVDVGLLFSHHRNAYLQQRCIGKCLHPLAAKYYLKAMLKGNFNVRLAKNKDIHHSTYYLGQPKKIDGDAKLVSTLYDMIPELMPKFFKRYPHANKLKWFEESDLIISISDSAASDLVYIRPDLSNKIRRIHLYSAFTPNSRQTKPKSMQRDFRPYILFIGNRGNYKNANMLMRAFAASKPSQHDYKLIFAGGGVFTRDELATISILGIGNYVQQLDVTDSELWYLYMNSKSILVPSIAEGFSLPLVEGLVADVPIVCSDIPVHREIAENFATLVNPMQHNDWQDILRSIENLKKPSELLSEQSYIKRMEYFSKERMIKEHVDAYSDLLK